MIEKTTQSVANLGYHAHIYYDPTRTRAIAERVCAAIGDSLTLSTSWASTALASQCLRTLLAPQRPQSGGARPEL
jgi:hypothetical protein